VKYTEPHSAFIPVGAITDGFSFTQGSSFGILSWGEGFIVSYDDSLNHHPLSEHVLIFKGLQ